MPNKATSDYGSFAYAFDLPELRWRQTANFGYVPNQQLPMTFMASSIDLLETPHTLEGYDIAIISLTAQEKFLIS